MIYINKKINFDKKYLKISLYVLGVAFLCIAFEKVLNNFVPLAGTFGSVINSVKMLVLPFIYGFFIAYFLNPIASFFQNRLFVKIPYIKKRERLGRMLSIAVTYIIVFGGIVWILYYLIPEILFNISNLLSKVPDTNEGFKLDVDLYKYIEYIPYIDPDSVQSAINSALDPLLNKLADLPTFIEGFIDTTVLAATNIVKFLFGILLAFYMLYEKNNFQKYSVKVIRTFFKNADGDRILRNFSRINKVYTDFIIGKAIDSLIIGLICFTVLTIIGMPYALLVSVIVGVTNMIPYFGPLIGAIPSVAIVLLVSPMSALVLAIFIFILQQFDGIVLGPKILGMSVGLSPLWILFSITVGGSVGGIFGMFLGVPTIATIKMFADEAIDRKYNKKLLAEQAADSPENTDFKEEKD